MKKILIPTDFSKNSSDALFYAEKLYGGKTVEFVVVYSFESEVSSLTSRVDIGKSEQVVEKLYTEAEEEGALFLKSLKEKLGETHSNFRFIATSLEIYRAVNKLIQKEAIELTVMGTKGRSAEENILMGSTTAKMIQKIKGCPLLVVPEMTTFEIPSKIGFATDFTAFFDLANEGSLKALTQQFNATWEVIHVGEAKTLNETQQDIKKAFKDNLKEIPSSFHEIPLEESVSKSLAKFTEEQRLDLLCLLNRKHNAIIKLFREPIIKKVGNTTQVPYLLLPVT